MDATSNTQRTAKSGMSIGRLLLLAATAASACVFACACRDSFDEPRSTGPAPPEANISIAALCEAYAGRTVLLNGGLVISGRVTTSDRAGNFRYSFAVDDGTGGVEVMARLSDLHRVYPEGSIVAVSLDGLAMGESRGVKQIGLMPAEYGYYPTDYIPSRTELDLHIFRSWDGGRAVPLETSAAELTAGMCGRLVRIAGMRCEGGTWAGYAIFEDAEGRRIATSVSDYADFAEKSIPEGAVALTGILQYGRVNDEGEMFIVKLRDEGDCGS
ncbi:MAG: hypothetical protein K2J51_04915 [Alistipes sp.]|nr:hypothetical protein [Alistipes sp.]